MVPFQMDIKIPTPHQSMHQNDNIMLMGSCFTEHISSRMERVKMNVLANPSGILFNPLSISKCLQLYMDGIKIKEEDLFQLNEIWNHWQFHSRFSNIDKQEALKGMNYSILNAKEFIERTDWLIITLGSAFQYFLKNDKEEFGVANCHRAPGQWFEKRLLDTNYITNSLKNILTKIKSRNPNIQIIFTISPVRHVRDGVVENNRSKARLIESVHELCNDLEHCNYFPSYELVIDVLRDYRYYDIDLVHPNYAATQFVWEHFMQTYFDDINQILLDELNDIAIAMNHTSRFPETNAHQNFLKNYAVKILNLSNRYPYINFEKEKKYFNS